MLEPLDATFVPEIAEALEVPDDVAEEKPDVPDKVEEEVPEVLEALFDDAVLEDKITAETLEVVDRAVDDELEEPLGEKAVLDCMLEVDTLEIGFVLDDVLEIEDRELINDVGEVLDDERVTPEEVEKVEELKLELDCVEAALAMAAKRTAMAAVFMMARLYVIDTWVLRVL